MSIQIIGFILIPLGIFVFFKNTRYLLLLTVFFSSFTATSVINIGDFSLLPSYYFGILFIIKNIFIVMKNKMVVKYDKFLGFFIILCVFSLIMPKILERNNITIMNQDSIWVNLAFTSNNITQILYLLFCFAIYWFSKDYLYHNQSEIENVIKILIYSSTVICLLGFYQEIAYIKGWEFNKFFRNAIHGNVQGLVGFVRVYSVTQEPSMLAYFLAPILALSIPLDEKILKHKMLFALLIISTGILSTSTTFIVGILALIIKIILDKCIALISLNRKKINKQKIGYILPFISFIFIVCLIFLINVNPIIKDTLIDGTINKFYANNQSGMERTSTFTMHLNVALKHPILGVGFGSARSKDLLSTWLCNVGILATGVFMLYIGKIILKLNNNNKLGYGISNFLFVLFVCAFISVPEAYYLFIWLMFAVGEILIINNKYADVYQNKITQWENTTNKFKLEGN